MTSALPVRPFDGIRSLLRSLPGPDQAAAEKVRRRDATLTKPSGSLGRLEELAEWLAAWQGRHPPRIDNPVVVVFAGNHGVVRQASVPIRLRSPLRWSPISSRAAPQSISSAVPSAWD